ncbi:MAG: hypothetical protein JWR80_6791 [Bradyrhizobium sp.]|nr:hypothetical protein [Bradyrhizobium sp.]
MKLDPNCVRDHKIKGDLDSGKLARGARSPRGHDVLVAAVLLVLLVKAILTHAPISIEVGDSSLDRQSYVAFAINVVVTLGLSWLLFSSRPRADNEGARS